MRNALFPFRWVTALAFLTCTSALTVLQTGGVFGWAPVRWTLVSALAREVLFLTGPLACVLSAYVASSNNTVSTTTVPGRPWGSIVRRHLTMVGGSVTAGYVIGLAPAIVHAADHATAGGPNVLVFISGFAGLAVFVAVGYVIGSMVSGSRGVALAGGAGFITSVGLMLLSDTLTSKGVPLSLFAVIPFWSYPLGRGSVEVAQVSAFRIVFLLAVAVSLIWFVVRWLEFRHAQRRVRVTRAVRAFAPTVALAALALAVQPNVALPDPQADVTCREFDQGEVCMYAEEEAVLASAADAIESTLEKFGADALSGRRFTSVHSDQLSEQTPGDSHYFTPQYIYDRKWFSDQLILDTAREIMGVTTCEFQLRERYGAEYFNTAPEATLKADVFRQWLAAELANRTGAEIDKIFVLPNDDATIDQPGTERISSILKGASDAQLRNWLQENQIAIRACGVGPEDFEL